MAEYIRVRDLNALARQVLENCEPLNNLILCGEVSNFTRHSKSGHLYFTLKDEQSSVKAVMFRDKARLLGFAPQNGMLVLAYGRATLYERDGAFQVYVEFMRPFGAGAAQMAFDALKKKLEGEGLFDPVRKRPLPRMPHCIGVVTSRTGAALQDVCNVISRRWPMTKLLLAPVNVQGLEAEQSIVDGIHALDSDPRPELILVTRGGGSKEDLWVFNSERIARAAAACRKPVVSAVGHEIDYTILDYVADLRAPTPSAAAEVCVPDIRQIRQDLFILGQNIQKNIQSRYQMCYNSFSMMAPQRTLDAHKMTLDSRRQALQDLESALQSANAAQLRQKAEALQGAAAVAESLNPYGVLARGYTIIRDEKGNCRTAEQLKAGQTITLQGDQAAARCIVEQVEHLSREDTDESTKKL